MLGTIPKINYIPLKELYAMMALLLIKGITLRTLRIQTISRICTTTKRLLQNQQKRFMKKLKENVTSLFMN